MSRRDRRGCDYDAYLPDPLLGWDLTLTADVAADVADAEGAVRELNAAGTTHVSLEGLARFLLRAESVASSMIEGRAAAPRRLVAAEEALARGGDARDQVAVDVLGNVAAMQEAIELASGASRFSLEDLLTVHRTLMERSGTPRLGGVVRTEQNWIGGSSYNPCSAAFVPPPPEHVGDLLDDLIEYVNGDDHSPLVQAALAHAQFETIHPFADGNGRTGRALIHVVLNRRRLAPAFVPPVSLVLATWADTYVGGLMRFRHLSPPDSAERSAAATEWLRLVATATHRACVDAESYAEQIDAMTARWRAKLGRVRAKSSTDLLLKVLPGVPLVSVETASGLIGRSKARTTDAINACAQAGILRQRNVGRQRYRVFEATDVLDLFAGLERTLASPSGDTLTAPPARDVPSRSSRDGSGPGVGSEVGHDGSPTSPAADRRIHETGIMSALLTALSKPAPAALGDLGGSWDSAVLESLSAAVADPVERARVTADLTRDQAWALLSWAEGACSWAVRARSTELLHSVLDVLSLLDGKLDRRDLLVVATLARRATRRLGTDLDHMIRSHQIPRRTSLPAWIATASEELPPTHAEVGHGETFEFQRQPADFDPVALGELLRDDSR